MKRDSKMLILISSLVFFAVSCGIPNYFGDVYKYVTFDGKTLEIEDKSYSDGFSSSALQPKLMFLYTIYDGAEPYSGISLSSIESRLKTAFQNEYRLSDYDYRGCSDTSSSVVEVSISDSAGESRIFGLYQFLPLKNMLDASAQVTATNASPDYLFNQNNAMLSIGSRYRLVYETKQLGDSTSNYRDMVVITVIDDVTDTAVASYALGYKREKRFFPFSLDEVTKIDEFAHVTLDPVVAILPVLYLESSEYNNKQVVFGSWQELSLKISAD